MSRKRRMRWFQRMSLGLQLMAELPFYAQEVYNLHLRLEQAAMDRTNLTLNSQAARSAARALGPYAKAARKVLDSLG